MRSRDQGALDAPILSHSTNHARRGSHKRPDPSRASETSAPTRRGDSGPAGRGLPQRTPFPLSPVRDDGDDPKQKMRAFDGEGAIGVAQL